ncbi:MAG: universal stress protein [Pseudomonas sp.]|jgi:nucleotide-binding universal stress UspA family protein|nr:universal stress protein [Pseudomonas sp.]MDD2223826.1 universal stress protein [Pseudomonas sp.]MDY0415728.1 universal stress protein [Pseudomonas sp.]NLO53413.1 universal stress protein [Gammaproteobacteria bacterium]
MQHILACLDESTWSTSVQDAAIWAARQLNSPLTFLHSIEKQTQPDSQDLSGAIGLGARSKLMTEIATLDQLRAKAALQIGKEILAIADSKAQEAGCTQVETLQRHGEFIDTLLTLESSARLVIIGHSGTQTGKKISVLGTHVENLLRQIHTPVLITPHDFSVPKSFMLAYDGRETTELALQRILSNDLLRGLDCHLVTIKNKQPDLEEQFAQATERLTAGGFAVTTRYLEGDIAKQLLDYQQTQAIDMLVMGAFSGSRLRQFFIGSNTLKMLENCNIPILVVK